MKLGTAINASLSVLWLLSAIAVFVSASWLWQAGWIADVDQFMRQRYIYDVRMRNTELFEKFAEDHDLDRHIRELTQLIGEFRDVQKGDVLADFKRTTYAELVWANQQANNLATAYAWVNEWIEFDGRDIGALTEKARLLMLAPVTVSQGIEIFDDLQHRFPESLPVADARATALAQSGQLGEAFSSFLPFLPSRGEVTDPLIVHIGDPVGYSPNVMLIENEEPVRGSSHWNQHDYYWTLTIDPGPAFDTVVLRPRQELPIGLSLDVVTSAGKIITPEVHPTGLAEVEDGFYRKQSQRFAELKIAGIKRDPGDVVQIQVIARIAPPDTLVKLFLPQVRPVLIDQLKVAGNNVALSTYEQNRDAFH